MPEIDRARLKAKLETIPEVDREPYLISLKSQGYTWRKSTSAITPSAPESPLTTAGAAKQAIGETMREDLPYVGRAVQAVRKDIPEYIAEKGGAMGFPKTGAAIGTAIGTAGEMLPKTGLDLALVGGAKPLAAGAKMAVRKVAPAAISAFTRIEKPIVERAIARPGLLADKTLLAPDKVEGAIKALADGIKAGRSSLGDRLSKIEDAVADRLPGRRIQVQDIALNIERRLSKAGFSDAGDVKRALESRVRSIVDDFHNLQGGKPASTSPIVDAFGKEIKTSAVKAKPTPLSFADGLNLRRKIDDVLEEGKKGLLAVPKQTTAFLTEARTMLNDRLKALDQNFRKANDAFANMARNYEQIELDVMGGKAETIQKRITNLFKKESVERKLLNRLDKSMSAANASLDTILDSITAQRFAPKINPMLVRAATQTGGGLVGNIAGGAVAQQMLGGPKALALGASILGATSPKLHSGAIRAAAAPFVRGSAPLARPAAAAALAALRARRKENR